MRIKNSIGQTYVNKGSISIIDESKFVLDRTRSFFMFDVIPMGAVRMTVSDKWKTNPNHIDPKKRQRKEVGQYFAYKNILRLQSNLMQYEMKDSLDVVFFIPMPETWSKKKKDKMNGMPHQSKPDTDNLVKGLKDALMEKDQTMWFEKAEKRWAYNGSIIIFETICGLKQEKEVDSI